MDDNLIISNKSVRWVKLVFGLSNNVYPTSMTPDFPCYLSLPLPTALWNLAGNLCPRFCLLSYYLLFSGSRNLGGPANPSTIFSIRKSKVYGRICLEPGTRRNFPKVQANGGTFQAFSKLLSVLSMLTCIAKELSNSACCIRAATLGSSFLRNVPLLLKAVYRSEKSKENLL